MRTELDLIADHLESIVFLARGMPVSEHQRFLLKRATDAHTHWVQTYTHAAERDGRSTR